MAIGFSHFEDLYAPPAPPPPIAPAEPPLDLVNVAEPPPSATVNPPDDRPAWGHFQYRFATGEAHGRSKLTRAMVTEARALRAAGWSTGRLAARYGVARATICYALNGKTWRES